MQNVSVKCERVTQILVVEKKDEPQDEESLSLTTAKSSPNC